MLGDNFKLADEDFLQKTFWNFTVNSVFEQSMLYENSRTVSAWRETEGGLKHNGRGSCLTVWLLHKSKTVFFTSLSCAVNTIKVLTKS